MPGFLETADWHGGPGSGPTALQKLLSLSPDLCPQTPAPDLPSSCSPTSKKTGIKIGSEPFKTSPHCMGLSMVTDKKMPLKRPPCLAPRGLPSTKPTDASSCLCGVRACLRYLLSSVEVGVVVRIVANIYCNLVRARLCSRHFAYINLFNFCCVSSQSFMRLLVSREGHRKFLSPSLVGEAWVRPHLREPQAQPPLSVPSASPGQGPRPGSAP